MDLWGEIGATAGTIYTNFIGKGATNITQVKKKVKSKVSVEMAIGWLTREGKAKISKKGKDIKIEILP